MKKTSKSFKNKYLDFTLMLSFILCLYPIFFLSEIDIENSNILFSFSNYLVDVFPNIENISKISETNNLYHFAKVQITLSIILSFFLVAPMILYVFGKVYLTSLGYMKKDENYYISIINNQKVVFSKSRDFIITCVIFFAIFDYHLTGVLFVISNENLDIYELIYSSKLGLLLFSYIFSTMVVFFIIIIFLESLAQIKRRNHNE